MIEYFIRPMGGIRTAITRSDVAEFRRLEGMGFRAAPAGVVEGEITEGTLSLVDDYRRARACTNHAMKFTLTGPHMLCKTLMDHHYNSRAELALGLGKALALQVAELDPEVIQIDEANITGHPDEAEWAAAAINVVLDAEWRKLIGFLNALHCDHIVLEMAFRGYDELQYFKEELEPRIGLGLGVIDIKVNTVESPEQVAERIEQAAKIMGEGRIKWVHPDCGFWMNKRSIADRKIAALVKGRDLFLGR
jgi:5-methyltetrahydropteroyltriglutamate--homocysteine methyltransferase